MWMIVLRAATFLGIGAAVGSSVTSAPVIQHVPQPVYQQAASSISPFLIVAIALLVCAGVTSCGPGDAKGEASWLPKNRSERSPLCA